jgi:hypothetical protein
LYFAQVSQLKKSGRKMRSLAAMHVLSIWQPARRKIFAQLVLQELSQANVMKSYKNIHSEAKRATTFSAQAFKTWWTDPHQKFFRL